MIVFINMYYKLQYNVQPLAVSFSINCKLKLIHFCNVQTQCYNFLLLINYNFILKNIMNAAYIRIVIRLKIKSNNSDFCVIF